MKKEEALRQLKEIKEKTDKLIKELSEKSECREKIERLEELCKSLARSNSCFMLENNSLKETITALRKERNNYLIEELFYKQMLGSEKDKIKKLSFLCYLFIPLSFILLTIVGLSF